MKFEFTDNYDNGILTIDNSKDLNSENLRNAINAILDNISDYETYRDILIDLIVKFGDCEDIGEDPEEYLGKYTLEL